MATKKNEAQASNEAIKAAILDAVSELWDEHEQQIVNIRDKSQEQAIVVNFKNHIDCSESEAVVETTIRFSETFTDKRTNKITKDAENQLTVENAGRGGRQSDGESDEDDDQAAAEQEAPTVDEAVEQFGGVKGAPDSD